MRARYADGRAAIFVDAECELGAEALTVRAGEDSHVWAYAGLARGDDHNGRIVLKRKPDTGERLVLDGDADAALRAAAPDLCKPRAQGVESRLVVGGVIVAAWSLAAAFLVGIPFMADPIARVMPAIYREQIADVSWAQVNQMTQYCDTSDQAADILNAAALRMMAAAGVPRRETIWITIVDAPFPNAFALPDDSIIVTDDLIAMTESPDDLMGVIAHEIAHIEHNHVMTGVIRQMGAGIFFDIVFGGAGAGQAIAIASVNLAGLRYTRGDEEEADASGLDYLDAAHIDSAGLARLFERLQAMQEGAGVGEIPAILSSHPASRARAAAARARSRGGLAPSIGAADWQIVRQACGGSSAPPLTPLAVPEPAPTGPAPQGVPQRPADAPPEPRETTGKPL